MRIELQALEVGLEHIVDDASDSIRTIESSRTVTQHFDALDRADRHGIGVETEGRHAGVDDAGDRLRGWVKHRAATVDQQQRIALAKTAKADRGDVTTRCVGRTAAEHLLVEGHATQLRDRPVEIGAGNGSHGLDLFGADKVDGKSAGRLGALDLGTDDDDVVRNAFLLDRCRGVGGNGAGTATALLVGQHIVDLAHARAQILVAQRHDIIVVGRDEETRAGNDVLERLARIIAAMKARRARRAQRYRGRHDLQTALQCKHR